MGISFYRFTANLAEPTGTWVPLAVQNFTLIASGVAMRTPKYQKIPLFCKESPISEFLGAFIRLTILHYFFKFHVICITGYIVIAQKAILIVYNNNNINNQCHDNRIILTVCLCFAIDIV